MERLLPFGQWVYDKSRDSCDSSDSCSKKNPSAFYPCAKWYPFKFRGWIIQWSGGKICVHLCDLWETKIIICGGGGRNDLSVWKDITDPLYLPLKIRLSERRRSLFILPSVRILSKAGRTGLSASWESLCVVCPYLEGPLERSANCIFIQ